MHSLIKQLDKGEGLEAERRTIRLDSPCPQAGIAAALRRAFDNPSRAANAIEDEFGLLLQQVH